jgi:SnoaL-like domain
VNDLQIRTALERHWTASAAGDQGTEHEIYHDDAIVEYPQSGECIRGRQNVQALRSQHPSRPSGFIVRRIVGGGDIWVTEYVITYNGHRVNTVSIMEFQAGKVVGIVIECRSATVAG